jgi:hypothetical protein
LNRQKLPGWRKSGRESSFASWQAACLKAIMAEVDFSSPVVNAPALKPAASASASRADDSGFSFDDFLDIINPLQHLPIVSAIYRSLTGDKIGAPERILGDTLFGGIYGLFASLADTAFKAATGDYFGDTMLALLTGDDGVQTAATPKIVQPAKLASIQTPDVIALTNALAQKGVDADIAARAISAYRKTVDALPPS